MKRLGKLLAFVVTVSMIFTMFSTISFASPTDYTMDWYFEKYYQDDGITAVYRDTTAIDLDLIDYGSEGYYTVSFNGVRVYTSELVGSDTLIEGYYRSTFDNAITYGGNLAAGYYTVTFFDKNGNYINYGTCEVINTAESHEWYLNWYDSEGRIEGKLTAYYDVGTINLDLVKYYSSTKYYKVFKDGVLLYTSDPVSATSYRCEGYYSKYYDSNAPLVGNKLASGLYTIAFYDSSNDVIAFDTCVVSNSADGVNPFPIGGNIVVVTPTPTPTPTPRPTTTPRPTATATPTPYYNDRYEPNDTYSNATRIQLNTTYSAEIGDANRYYYLGNKQDQDIYAINLTAGVPYTFTVGNFLERFADTTLLINLVRPGDNLNQELTGFSLSYYMEGNSNKYPASNSFTYTPETSGTYYVRFHNYTDFTSYRNHVPSNTTYTLTVQAPNSGNPGSNNDNPANGAGVGGFVERLYTIALDRPSDPNGKADWVNRVFTQGASGADIARGFLFSPEFLGKNMSNAEFLAVLYRVFFDRAGDQGGIDYWLGQMAGGMDKQTVIMGFINSTEWANVCLRYGIASGGTGVPNITIEPSAEIVEFATRLYTTCLGREADPNGLADWASQLANRRISGSDAARGFFTSAEFVNANYDNAEYINRLYRTFMGREADQGGFDYWMGQFAQGASRADVFNGFAGSNEWATICSSYGILK